MAPITPPPNEIDLQFAHNGVKRAHTGEIKSIEVVPSNIKPIHTTTMQDASSETTPTLAQANPPLDAHPEQQQQQQQQDSAKRLKREHAGPSRTNSEVVDYEDARQLLNSDLQLAWSESIDESGLPGSTTYKKVHVLMLSWERQFDDLKVQGEVLELCKVFEQDFNYHVTHKELNRVEKRMTQLQVNKIVADWVYEHDASNSLLVVYFAGHGRPGEKPGELQLAGQKSPSDVRDYLDRVVWNKTEHALLDLQSDVLQIFDCCHAGNIETRGASTSVSEFLAATGADEWTDKPGDSSFTRALIWALKQLVKDRRRFTTTDLTNKIREAPSFPPEQRPVLTKRNNNLNGQLIVLQPLTDAASPLPSARSLVDSAARDAFQQDILTLKFVFETTPSREHISALAQGLFHVIHRDGLRVSRVMWGGIQPKQHDMVFKAIRRFRDAAGRRHSKDESGTEVKALALVAGIKEEVENDVLEKVKARTHDEDEEENSSEV